MYFRQIRPFPQQGRYIKSQRHLWTVGVQNAVENLQNTNTISRCFLSVNKQWSLNLLCLDRSDDRQSLAFKVKNILTNETKMLVIWFWASVWMFPCSAGSEIMIIYYTEKSKHVFLELYEIPWKNVMDLSKIRKTKNETCCWFLSNSRDVFKPSSTQKAENGYS